MTNTTPEQVAEEIADRIIDVWDDLTPTKIKYVRPVLITAAIKPIRAAVAAQKERCAEVNPEIVSCPLKGCIGSVGQRCTVTGSRAPVLPLSGFHTLRWRAAIRRPAPEPADE